MRTARYRAVPPKLTVGGRLKEKSIVGDRLREKKGRRRRKGKEERRRREEEYLVRSSPTRCRRPRVALELSLPASHRRP
ncbi:hypothetical protein GW17_00002502 [Ensete ventricosum]|nr:hypothetical protein GW17_00002502 [Ensete ventricosum]RZS15866.1 hypothetical protein BHM03_00047763 [Ensete ventricosum]